MATIQKNFRFSEEMLKKFNKLKENEKLTSDTDFLRKMIEYTELMQEMKKSKAKTVPLEEYKELQRQYQALLVELGRLKGLLEQKQELPKKKHWWQFW